MSQTKAQLIEGLNINTSAPADALVIDSSGNVGIGSSPHSNSGTNLHIHGSNTTAEIRLTNTTTGTGANGSIIQQGGNTLYISNSEAGNIAFENNGAERMRIASDGDVGIGTTSPATKLHVQQSAVSSAPSRSAALYLENNANCEIQFVGNASNDCQLRFGTTSNSFKGALEYELDNNNLKAYTNGSERLRIDSSGRLLLGTTTEGHPNLDDLTIATTGHTGITIRSGTSHDGQIGFSDGTSGDDEYRGQVLYNHGSNSMRFITDAVERMRIDSSGNVGIGTTSPGDQLHIHTASSGAANVRFSSTDVPNGFFVGFDGQERGQIWHTANKDIRIASNNTERMVIKSGGNVGIGKTSPSAKFEVSDDTQSGVTAGDLIVDTTSLSADVIVGRQSSTSNDNTTFRVRDRTDNTILYASAAGDPFRVGRNGSELARIDTSGRLMVGTTSVRSFNTHASRFQVQGTTFSSQTASIVANSADGNGAYLFFAKQRSGATGGNTIVQNGDLVGQLRFNACDGVDMETVMASMDVRVDGTPGSNDMPGRIEFRTTGDGGSGTTERMRIDNNGRVGIGTASTAQVLQVHKAASSPSYVHITNSVSGSSSSDGMLVGLSSTAEAIVWNQESTDMRFATNNQERMRINNSGQVLVNVTTASPNIANHYFRVYGQTVLGSIFSVGRSGGDYDGAGYNVGWQSSSGQYKYVASDSAAFIKYGGGNGRIETFTAAAGTAGNSISFTSGPYVTSGGTSWSTGSDERLKTNLSPIENGLAKVGTLRAVTGRYLTDEESTSRAFLIAQDVQTVLPEAVDDYDPESLGLDYPAMIPLLVAALKEAKDKIETLETSNADLLARVTALQAG